MKNTSAFFFALYIFSACNTGKKVIPVETNSYETQTFIVDTINPPSPTFISEGIGIDIGEEALNLPKISQILSLSNAAWIQIKPVGGVKYIFQSTIDTIAGATAIDNSVDLLAIKNLLLSYDSKLAIVIDPRLDQPKDIMDVAQQIKDWKLPFSHWQIAEKPYLELLDTIAPFWNSGSDFAKKMQFISNAIKKVDASQDIIYAAGNTNRNLFTDEILKTESEYFAWSGLALYNFYSLQIKKSEYFQKKSQYEKKILIHLVSPSQSNTGADFALLFENMLATKSRLPKFKVDIQISDENLKESPQMGALTLLNQLLKNGSQIQTRYTPLNSTKESTIQSITVFTDTSGNKTIAFSNPFNRNLTVDLSTEFDNSTLFATNYTLLDSIKTMSPSNKIAVRPYSFTVISASQKLTNSTTSLSITSINSLDQQNLVIKWQKQEKFAKYQLNFGLNKNNLDQKFETTTDSFHFYNVRIGRTYFFNLQGLDSTGVPLESKTFEFKAIPPDIPRISNIRRDSDKLIIHWTPIVEAQNYTLKVYRKGFIEELEVGQQNLLILDNLPDNESYRFAVKSQNVYGESAFSPISKASQKGILPLAPTNFHKEGNLFIWNTSGNVANETIRYQLYKGSHPNELQEFASEITDTTFYYFDPINEDTYFAIKANNNFGKSESYSNILSLLKPQPKSSYIFDAYPSGDSTNIIVKYFPNANNEATRTTTLIIQDRSKTHWVE
ncbi:MAG TPA: fibronectin type III domain-containing protein, partial [Saprospiraceae bacterium]|nr:fibronectin type III domain-containing protein [Saprospiraceae bacterium]